MNDTLWLISRDKNSLTNFGNTLLLSIHNTYHITFAYIINQVSVTFPEERKNVFFRAEMVRFETV